MRTDARRWPRATAISIALHGLFVLVIWWLSSRSASVVIFTPDPFGARFEPGAVLPIEITSVETSSAVAPRDAAARELEDERPGNAETGKRSKRVAAARSAERQAAIVEPKRVRQTSAGLLGGGREARGLDPDLLRGSRSLYDESGGAPEAPRSPPNEDFSFEREGDQWIYRDPGGDFVATLQPDGSVDFRNKVVKVKVGSMPAVASDGEEFITLDIEHDAVGMVRLARGRDPSPRAKAQLLAATFEFRLELATKHHKQRLIEQLGALDEELEDIWYASGRSLAERKRLLFERWDACE